MCGIIGYIGKRQALPIILEGLERLEYRGYDSAGVVVLGDKGAVVKTTGKIENLREKLQERKISGTIGLGHTRWATHGRPSDVNAHPHWDCSKEIFVVHNGIIENYSYLKNRLKSHNFVSETDTEVLAHLIEENYKGNLEEAVRLALQEVEGAYAIAVVSKKEPNKIVFARYSSPLLVALGEGENFVASDAPAILAYTKQVVYLNDGEMGVITNDGFSVFNLDNRKVRKTSERIDWDIAQAEKGGYDHFMLKEIFEIPKTIENAFRGRVLLKEGLVKFGGLERVEKRLAGITKLSIVSMGTALLAGKVGEYMIEEYAQLPVETENASEFRYKKPVISKDDAVDLIASATGVTVEQVKKSKAFAGILDTWDEKTSYEQIPNLNKAIDMLNDKSFVTTDVSAKTLILGLDTTVDSNIRAFLAYAIKDLETETAKLYGSDYYEAYKSVGIPIKNLLIACKEEDVRNYFLIRFEEIGLRINDEKRKILFNDTAGREKWSYIIG